MKFEVGELALLVSVRDVGVGMRNAIPPGSVVEVLMAGHWNKGDQITWVDGRIGVVGLEAQYIVILPGVNHGAAVMEWQLRKINDPDAGLLALTEEEQVA